jgi:preprotein translocase subunit SecG
VLQWVVGIIHVVNLFVLGFLILLHSGRGGGLSDMFGGGASGTAAGSTVVERNLDRMTVVSSLIFAFTTVALGLYLAS